MYLVGYLSGQVPPVAIFGVKADPRAVEELAGRGVGQMLGEHSFE
jgi:hypothetical protein